MTSNQIAVVVAGLFVGYWLVSLLFRGRNTAANGTRPTPETDPFGGGYRAARDRRAEDTSGQPWHVVLGVSSSAGVDEIKTAYKRLITQYHPDKVATLGPELQALAELKTRQITSAYGDAMRGRG